MSASTQTWTPTETPDCCEAWPKLITMFDWMKYHDFPDFLTMAHLKIDGVPWRINHCPSCGAERRDVNIKRERIF